MTETTTLTLTDFLLARLAEDQHTAEFAPNTAEWAWRPETPGPLSPLCLALPDVPRVLAECEAKRRIVKALAAREDPDAGLTSPEDRGATWALRLACATHAAVYADHPDYREEWRP